MQSSNKSLFWRGLRNSLPLLVGVAPFGFVFGALAATADMSIIEALGMSILVIAGASQFVAATLIDDNAPIAVIVFTTFIVNLRHFLYSASVTEYVRPVSIRWKLLLGYIMIDEVFATAIRMKEAEKPTPQQWCWYFFGSGISLVIVWYTTTVLGALLGKVISDDTTDVLGFSLPLIFTAIVVPMLKQNPALLAAVSAAAAGIIFAPMPNKLGLIVAAGVGIAAGVMAERVYGAAEAS
jgi:4-azaleucine resistance transporter AzlC